ncbi:MAG: NAD(P)-binding protein, partial [Gammaproteobacteria bacterium]
MAIKIAIVGGGIGGLALAQKLKKAGVEFNVYERDASSDDRLQGYRVHLSPEADRALSECLPTKLYDLFIKTSGVAKRKQAVLFLDTHLDELMSIPLKQPNIGQA